jgi:hypothetical protein
MSAQGIPIVTAAAPLVFYGKFVAKCEAEPEVVTALLHYRARPHGREYVVERARIEVRERMRAEPPPGTGDDWAIVASFVDARAAMACVFEKRAVLMRGRADAIATFTTVEDAARALESLVVAP